MDCERIQKQLSPLLDGELERSEELAVRSHLGTCDRCARRWRTLVALRTAVTDLRPGDSPAGVDEGLADLRRRIRATAVPAPAAGRSSSRRRAIAAGIAVVALLAALFVGTTLRHADGPAAGRATHPAPAGEVTESPGSGESPPPLGAPANFPACVVTEGSNRSRPERRTV